MRKLTAYLLLLLPVLLIYAICCTPISIHEFFAEEDVFFEPALIGDWHFEDESEPMSLWSFTESDEDHYWLHHSEYQWDGSLESYVPKMPQLFDVHLFKLDGNMYFDICPHTRDGSDDPAANLDELNYMLNLCSIYGHTLWLVTQLEPELSFTPLNLELVSEYLLEHPDAVMADTWGAPVDEDETQGIVLLSVVPDLREFVMEISEQPDAFDEDEPAFSLIRMADSVHLDEIAAMEVTEPDGAAPGEVESGVDMGSQ